MSDPIEIIVVEDEALILMAVSDYLSDYGFKVFEASNADEAIALLERHPSVRIVFTDIDMPGSMNGLRLAAAVRDRWPLVKIMVTSGKRLIEVTDLPDGGVFFSKPYDQKAICSAMQSLLAG